MIASLSTLSPVTLTAIAEFLKAMADPMRLRILQSLHAGEQSVSAIVQRLRATQPNISKHLRLLTRAGILTSRREGTTIYYTVAHHRFHQLCQHICHCFHTVEQRRHRQAMSASRGLATARSNSAGIAEGVTRPARPRRRKDHA